MWSKLGLFWAGKFELIFRVAVPVGGGHAADGEVAVGADALEFGVVEFIGDFDGFDGADDEAVGADALDGVNAAFEGDWGVSETWSGDGSRRCCFELLGGDFADSVRKRGGALYHFLGEMLGEEMNDEFAACFAIDGGVLGGAVVAIAGGEDDEWRL